MSIRNNQMGALALAFVMGLGLTTGMMQAEGSQQSEKPAEKTGSGLYQATTEYLSQAARYSAKTVAKYAASACSLATGIAASAAVSYALIGNDFNPMEQLGYLVPAALLSFYGGLKGSQDFFNHLFEKYGIKDTQVTFNSSFAMGGVGAMVALQAYLNTHPEIMEAIRVAISSPSHSISGPAMSSR